MNKKRTFAVLAALIMVAIGIVTFNACKKIQDYSMATNSSNDSSNTTVIDFDDKGIGFPISWEWHRKKYDCKRGFGICNFIIGKPKPTPELSSSNDSIYYTYIQFDNRNYCDMEIVLCGTEQFDDTIKNLYVDEDIIVVGSDGYIYKINEGVYSYNGLIGSHGGYNVNIYRSLDNE